MNTKWRKLKSKIAPLPKIDIYLITIAVLTGLAMSSMLIGDVDTADANSNTTAPVTTCVTTTVSTVITSTTKVTTTCTTTQTTTNTTTTTATTTSTSTTTTTTTTTPVETQPTTTTTTTIYISPNNSEDRPIIPDCPLSDDFQQYVYDTCIANGVEYELVMAVMCCESGFNADAFNGTCYGLMQIHKCNIGWASSDLGVTDLSDPYGNALVGITILSDFRSRYNISDALLCYNRGEGGAQGYLGTSTSYTEKVLSKYNYYLSYEPSSENVT